MQHYVSCVIDITLVVIYAACFDQVNYGGCRYAWFRYVECHGVIYLTAKVQHGAIKRNLVKKALLALPFTTVGTAIDYRHLPFGRLHVF
jgi:hypothetical protein